MQVSWLQAFVAVVETGSVLSAALRLGRTQSRVSTHISQLEKDLGVVLLDRSRRPLALTVAGDIFLGHAREALKALEMARTDLEHLSGRRHGTVRLACIPSVAGTFAPRVIESFGQTEPNISLHILEMATSTIPDALREGRADMAILPRAYVEKIPEIAWDSLWVESLVVVVSASHILAARSTVEPRDLLSEVIVTAGSSEGGRGLSPEAQSLLTAVDVDPQLTRRVASPHTLAALVRRGSAVGIVNMLALEITGKSGLVALRWDGPTAVREVVLARRRGGPAHSATEILGRFVPGVPIPAVARRTHA